MSRHRNVRSMNYSDEYDGYDDVYGHSVEDEYCISPSDEAQFMYDRTRQPQMSAFFSEQDNITEEDEHVDQGNIRRNSDSYTRPTLSDINEAKLRSCLEEIRNVIGDSISEKVLVETIIKYDFNVNRSLDAVLSNVATSSSDASGDIPKPQRVRKERDRDSVIFQTCSLDLIHHSDVVKDNEPGLEIELQDTALIPDRDISFPCKHRGRINKDICNELNIKDGGSVISCNSILVWENRNVCESVIDRNSNTNSTTSFINHSIHIPFLCDDRTENNKNSNKYLARNVSHFGSESELVHVEFPEKMTENSPNNSDASCTSSNNDPCFNMDEKKVDLFPEDCSSDEECMLSPLAVLAKQHSDVLNTVQKQHLGPRNFEKQRTHDVVSERKSKQNSDDPCSSFTGLRIQDSEVQLSGKCQKKETQRLSVQNDEQSATKLFESQYTSIDDNSDKEENMCSPHTTLVNKHHNQTSPKSFLSGDSKYSMNTLPSRSERILYQNDTCEDGMNDITRRNVRETDSVCEGKQCYSGDLEMKDMILDKSSDEDESTFSPLAALADKYNKGKEVSANFSVVTPGLKNIFSVFSSPSEQKCAYHSADSTSVSSLGSDKEVSVVGNELFCSCKSKQSGFSKSLVCSHSTDREIKSKSGLECSCSKRNMNYRLNKDDDDEILKLSHAVSERVTVSESDSQDLTNSTSVSSLSDLAFHHLTRSASCNVKTDHEIVDKKSHSDMGISKSVPCGFFIPFLKPEEGCLYKSQEISSSENILGHTEQKEEVSDHSMDSTDEWIIDLSSAVRDPELRVPYNDVDNKSTAQVINVENIEEQENTRQHMLAPCELNASGLLKMKFSYTKRRCSPFGSVLCHRWCELAKPYIVPKKHDSGTVVRFSFSERSPDDIILYHLNIKK